LSTEKEAGVGKKCAHAEQKTMLRIPDQLGGKNANSINDVGKHILTSND
jgi:hypothetical protein